ncbi:EAL and HDOD domain-containing protein [Nitrosomonas ureae]|uniref:EAL and modified HD-GYP domain-containing signal transduction protein n=1 Tax=Nitrosomonas ureae TaxID=44577 RepID=A0A0S3AGT4_9PROT|nr:HDOD domain-containing protein [Nitrosomonas ureae]ALQ50389.1 diguanylate phosphodiesterase [Nitrosomonas ureae]SDT87526.1 EAL and modified HD-GYP domain-containing signal transduction protein [Nitrosomonas ureae]SEP64361.1 EAL and modified HD-GYP domain-containing signal transduction protein [Nitrosomonas ureae]
MEVYLGRLPILDSKQNLVAFELLFRSNQNNGVDVTDNSAASANVIIDTYGQLGIENVIGKRRGFIKVDAKLLMNDVICMLPKKHVVLEILRNVEINDEIIQRCLFLKQKGYQLALSNVVQLDQRFERIMPLINIVKINITALNQSNLHNLINKLKRWPVLLLAEKVESKEIARNCIALNFQMLQGFYFAKPEIISGKRIDPSKLSLLKLLLLVVKDGEVTEIENELKFQPGLSYNLLRMVNSAASGLPSTINSIKRAIMIIGRKQLQRWIQILLYAAKQRDGGASDALMQTATVRGRLLESIAIADRPHDKNHQDRAFMVGVLSLLDTLLGMEMSELVSTLSIQKDMGEALLTRRGYLGHQLELIEAHEKGEYETVSCMLSDMGFINMDEFIKMELEATVWANRIKDAVNQSV